MAISRALLFVILAKICASAEQNISSSKNRDDLPIGHPARCLNLLGRINQSLLRLEALPGTGWDNLHNKETSTVVQHSYSQCKTSADRRFLIPDGVTLIPVKSSKVDTVAEYFDHWDSYTSVTASSINTQVDVHGLDFGGKFSSEYESIKTKQQFNRASSATTRMQTDQLKLDDSLTTASANQQFDVSAAAFVFFEELAIDAKASYSESSSSTSVQKYKNYRTSSELSTYGGISFRPSEFTAEQWSKSIENNLVALDRTGDPIYLYINEATLPDLPEYMVEKVHNLVKTAVHHYYKHNVYRGCTDPTAPNFSFQANINDGKCKPPKTNFTFGGVYQTCSGTCDDMWLKNPLTGDYSCPDNYEPVLLKKGTKSFQRPTPYTPHKCGFLHSLHLKKCATRTVAVTVRATYSAFWCAVRGDTGVSGGYMFGGLYTSHINNVATQTNGCPTYFSSLKILDDLNICVSDDYELGTQYLLPFAGFFSCDSGNPLAINTNKRASATAESYPRNCPDGYSQHLAVVDDGCEVEYCMKSGAIKAGSLPRIHRPPFMTRPLDIHTDNDDKPVVVFSSDGSPWTTMEEELEPSQNLPPGNKSPNLTSTDENILDVTEIKPLASSNEKKSITVSDTNTSGESKTDDMAFLGVVRYRSNTDSDNLEKENNEIKIQVSSVTVAVISSTGTILGVLLIGIIVFVIKRYRVTKPTYQRI